MSTNDWLVIAGGSAAILWVNWYFFFASRQTGGNPPLPPADRLTRVDPGTRTVTAVGLSSSREHLE